jgi:Family of unknown function (DUF5682)
MSAAKSPDTEKEDVLERVGDQLEVDAETIRRQCDGVLNQVLYWFPVRHHSPSVARYLEVAILKRKPKMIFIEGPFDANHLIEHIVDGKTKPPVAIYCSYRDDANVLGLAGVASPAVHIPARFASWYPLLSYSPEYVAMAAAKKIGAKVQFIDLPHHAQIKPATLPAEFDADHLEEEDEGDDDDAAGEGDERDAAAKGQDADKQDESDKDDKDREDREDREDSEDSEDRQHSEDTFADPHGQLDQAASAKPSQSADKSAEDKQAGKKVTGSERLILESSFYQKLAAVAGFRTWNEAWDSLFEIRDFNGDPEAFRRELATFCAAARATSNPKHIAADGTLERERFMLKTIRETLASQSLKPEECMVVCGGFHLFMDVEDEIPPPVIPDGSVYSTVVPFSYFRVSELSGYGAGNRAPQFYQTAWDLQAKNRLKDLLIEHVVAVLKQARKGGEPLSSADAISTCQHAEMLARLRGRPMPVLDDIHDAIITCCCKGDPKEDGIHLLKALGAADIGTRIGRVTDALGQLPIVNDFYKQLDDLELGSVMNSEQRVTVSVDRRNDLNNRQAIFLHRTSFLGVPLGTQTDAPSGDFISGTLFKEKWALRWNPGIESTLVEKNLYGDTIESAALAQLREELSREEMHAGKTSDMLVSAANMDLPNLIHEVEDALSKAIDNDSRFVSLTRALSNLVVIERYAIYRNLRRGIVDDLIERCFDRACFSILDIIAVPEDQQPQVVTALMTVAEIVLRGDRETLDRNLYIEHVRQAASATEVAFLRGVLLGILTELRVNTPADLARELSLLAKAPVEIMITAGDFLDGIMAASRTSIMLGAKALIIAIDELLRAAEWDPFLVMLPRMRAAFERLHDNQKESVAETVAQLYGLEEADSLTELRTSVGAAAMIAKIDQKVARIMKEFDF